MGISGANEILILKPQEMCYHLLDIFADELGNALVKLGCHVLYYDLKEEPLHALTRFQSMHLSAIIDMYSGLLEVRDAESGELFFNLIDAPVFQFIFDYPLYIRDKMKAPLKRYYTLMLDQNHVDLVKQNYKNINDAFLLPPTGVCLDASDCDHALKSWEERPYDVSFVGTYSDYHKYMKQLSQCGEDIRYLGSAYLRNMLNNPLLDQFSALEMTFEQLGINVKPEERYLWVEQLGIIGQCAASFYRGQIIHALIDAGIDVHVFGDSWNSADFAVDTHLHIHNQLDPVEYPLLMSKTKIALNILPWNKKGVSERLFYGLLNGALCVSERNSYLEELFTDQNEICFYTYGEIKNLPEVIGYYRSHPEKAVRIAQAGQKSAMKNHTWIKRAQDLVRIMQS